MSKKFSDPWVRTFTVGDPIRHKKGYTLYKVTSKVFPRNSIEAVTQVTVWKRYNDFKKLHKTLSTLHQGLYLKGTFPTFAKARFFGRFDDTVIEERRHCALELLEFAAKHPPLFTSQVFVKFFEGGQVVDPTDELEAEECEDSVLQPISSCSTSGAIEVPSSNEEANDTLGGIWKHRQAADEISVGSHATEDEDDDRTTFTDDDPSKSTISDLSEFDPLTEASSSKSVFSSAKSEDLCHDWLLSAFQSFGASKPEKNENELLLTFPKPFSDLDDLDIPSETESHNVIPQNVPSSETQDFLSIYDTGRNFCEPDNLNVGLTSKPLELFSSSYIHIAAKSVAAAKEAELSEHFFNAFTCYKDAIDTLLLGVKGEQNFDQQEAVQKKILQYLKRAEEIYETHLIESKKCQKPVVALSEDCSESHVGIRRSMKDLAKYRVIGILSKVLLVLDVVTNITCIVKVLRKSPEPQEPCAPNIAPRSIDFMVQLYEMYETSDTIFLILEYASGGRLWDYISSYLQRSPLSPNNEYNPAPVGQEPKADLNNVYSGKKIHSNTTNVISETTPSNNCSSLNDLGAMEIYPSSYAALFRNYAANVSANSVSLAKCSLKRIPVPPDFQDVESSKDTLCFRSIDNMAETLDYIDDVQNCPEFGMGEDLHHSNKDAQQQDPFKKNGFSSDLRTSFNSINSQGNNNPKALLQNLHKTFASPDSGNIQSDDTTIGNTDLPTFLCENAGKAFMNQKEHEGYLNGGKKSNSMLQIDTDNASQRCWPKPGFTEVFHQMDVELSLASSKPTFLPESCIVLWAAEIVVAVESLHKLGIIWKDLRPENILLGTEGHILLSYQSQWNSVDNTINDKAVQNFYAAPEVSNVFGVTPSCDYWSLGAILFELLTGRRLVSCYPSGVTAHTTIKVPVGVSSTAEDLLQKLLKYEPSERLGSGYEGILDIKQHPFFHSVNWKSLRNF